MKSYKTPLWTRAVFMVALIVGCGEKPAEAPTTQALPEANDKNCTPETIEKLKDKAAQQEFSARCFRRGTFTPTKPKAW